MMLGPVGSENAGAGSGIGRVRAFSLVILREMGPPIDHAEGGNWGPKMGSFWLLEMSQNSVCSQ